MLDDKVVSLHFYSAMRDQDWESAQEWLERLSLGEQHTPQWRYWRGRVLEAKGHLEEARSVYLLNGEQRGYYSFLAADRAGHRYQFAHSPITYHVSELADVESLPAIQRARELYAIKRTVDARREWNYAIERMTQPQLLKAAKLADAWGWHDRAISSLAQAKYWDDLELRFPLAHQQQVLHQAARQKINPAWAFAIIRQESAFTADARSHAGALGLMQLLPRTARDMARSLRVRTPRRGDLLKIDTNIQLGVGYLKKVQDRYQGHPVLATAAYNAGPSNVKRWLPNDKSVAADIWIETVPFKETRDYLKRVLTYTVIYEQRLGQQPRSLLERMTPISMITTTAGHTGKGRKDT
jgi:soluble lytic murein transglycosylase